jgi:hypothetical protein
MELTAEIARNGYLALFDDNTRAAHHAALIDARLNERGRWPTVAIVRKIAALLGVDVAELGAFFGLLSLPGGRGGVWVDIVRAPPRPSSSRSSACPGGNSARSGCCARWWASDGDPRPDLPAPA